MTPCIQIKRVYEAADPADGFRILVDRLWPRGIRKDALPYDLWPKDLTPSPALRRWFHEDPDGRWAEFSQRYRSELATAPSLDESVRVVKVYRPAKPPSERCVRLSLVRNQRFSSHLNFSNVPRQTGTKTTH